MMNRSCDGRKSAGMIPVLGLLAATLTPKICGAGEALKWLVPPRYDSTLRFSEGFGLAESGKDLYLIDRKGHARQLVNYMLSMPEHREMELLLPCLFTSQGRFAVLSTEDEKWHYLIAKTLAPLPGAWDTARPFSEGMAIVATRGHGFKVIRGDGSICLDLGEYDFLGQGYKEGLLAAAKEKPCGFLDVSGNWAIEPHFDECLDFEEGVAWVRKGTEWSAISREGKTIYTISESGEIEWVRGPLALLATQSGWVLFTARKGRILSGEGSIYAGVGSSVPPFSVYDEDGWRYIRMNGSLLTSTEFTMADPFCDGYAVFWQGPKSCGVLDRKGRIRIPPVLEWAGDAWKHIMPAKYGGKCGYIRLD